MSVKKIQEQSGAALIVVIGIISVMVIISVTVTAISINSDKTVAHDKRQTEARNVAEAGIDDAISMTIANYQAIYGSGIPGPTDANPDGPALFLQNQPLNDSNVNEVGTYQVYSRQDPDRAGNVLLTAKASVDGSLTDPNAFVDVVRVSVKYDLGTFDFALFPGAPSNTAVVNLNSQSGDAGEHGEDDGGANIKITGKVNVNGNLNIGAIRVGDDNDHDGHYGTVAFVPRDGYTDPVTYTGMLSGTKPSGTQPTQGSLIPFPVVDFSKFDTPPMGAGTVTTVTLPSTGVPTGGWTRSGSVFSISADNFQNTYKNFQVVKLTSAQTNVTVQILGGCNSPAITSTIMTPGAAGSTTRISELDLVGPGLTLKPTNGIAILSGEGLVTLQNAVTIGALNAGALIYLGGQNAPAASALQSTGNVTVFGSVIVNGNVDMNTQGRGEEDDDLDHHDGNNHDYYCGGGNDNEHQDEGHITNMTLTFDGAFLNNPNLPAGWWSWSGANGITAIKYNYEKD